MPTATVQYFCATLLQVWSWLALVSLISLLSSFVSSTVSASDSCPFAFESRLVESSAGQALILGADGKPRTAAGDWVPIYSRPENDRVRRFGRYIGRLDVCWEQADMKPIITYCTAALLEGNKILTNHHCFDSGASTKLEGYYPAEARLVMGYDDIQDLTEVAEYNVPTSPVTASRKADALIMRVRGNPNKKWGYLELSSGSITETEQALLIVHHPAGITKQFNPVSCHVHSSQHKAPFPQLRHVCDTAFGSSGSLILRESDLAIVGLHHEGGLRPGDHRTFNKAVMIDFVAKELDLKLVQSKGSPSPPKPVVDSCAMIRGSWKGIEGSNSCSQFQELIRFFHDSECFELNLAKAQKNVVCDSIAEPIKADSTKVVKRSCSYADDVSNLSKKQNALAFVRSYYRNLNKRNVQAILRMYPSFNRSQLTRLVKNTQFAKISDLYVTSSNANRTMVKGTANVKSYNERSARWAMNLRLVQSGNCFKLTSMKGTKKIHD